VRRLVAIDQPSKRRFLEALEAAWEAGDAVLPLDSRLAPGPKRRILDALAPSVLVDEHGEAVELPGGRPVEAGDALVIPTSGSSGEPKGVVLTHRAIEAAARRGSQRLRVDPSNDVWLACLPFAHIGGLLVALRALLTGTPLVVHDTFDPTAVKHAASAGATLVSLVPTALARVDASGFRRVLLGGADPLGPIPPNVTTTYGMTETTGGVVYDGVPLAGVQVALDDGTLARPGEILVGGPTLLRCYRDGTDPRRRGWLPTGDAGEIGADGRLRVHGRLDHAISTGGELVWPEPVEQALVSHPKVADAAVVGVPDPEWGERVVAVVVPATPSDPPQLGELRDLVAALVAPYAAPKSLRLADHLPRSALGKLRRGELARRVRDDR
jgi:O-succinylbenzoic acid--CoA ligase